MRETDSHGHQYVFMPRDREKAVNKLADLSALAASRDWERAALVALLVQNKGRGRPRAGRRGFEKYSIADFTRLSIYGFRSPSTISAYLKIWEMSGYAAPEPGDKIAIPSQEFPDLSEVYGRDNDKEAGTEEAGAGNEEEEEPRPRPRPRQERPRAQGSPIDSLLSAFNRVSPADVAEGASVEQVRLTVKTVASWLADLDEILSEMEKGV